MYRKTSLFVLRSIKKYKNTLCAECREFLNVKMVVYKASTWPERVKQVMLEMGIKMQVALYVKWLNFGAILNRAECVHTYLVGIPNIKFH
jgi:hypothetical protein